VKRVDKISPAGVCEKADGLFIQDDGKAKAENDIRLPEISFGGKKFLSGRKFFLTMSFLFCIIISVVIAEGEKFSAIRNDRR
jgi:hypothetical protein